jgi:hypothetical protein
VTQPVYHSSPIAAIMGISSINLQKRLANGVLLPLLLLQAFDHKSLFQFDG